MNKEMYDTFFKKHGPDVHLDPVRLSEISKLCKGAVLDLGCGTGNLSDFYKGEYVGVDISSVAIAYAKELRRRATEFHVCDIVREVVKIAGRFDTIVMAEFLEHIEYEDILWRNILEHARPDARIIVTVPNGDRVLDETHVREFTVPQLRKKFRDLGQVKFHNWAGFDKRILMTCDFGKKNENDLALVIIAKNEEKGLENAILSSIEIADEVVVSVDKSSTDGTMKIATRYADTVKEYMWEGSFCGARNFAQQGIRTKWALCLDGHEYVSKSEGLAEALNKDVDGVHVQVLLENGFSFYFPRLIRSVVKWEHAVHNAPICKTYKKLDNFIIKHDRENLQSKESREIRNKQRDEMIIGIFSKELEEDPGNIRASFYLAQHYYFVQDYKNALRYYRQYLMYSNNAQERWLVLWQMAVMCNVMGRYWRAWWYMNRGNKELPGRWETKFTLAVTWGLVDNAKKMAVLLVDSLLPNKQQYLYNPIVHDEAMIFEYLGVALSRNGNKEEGVTAWKRALEMEKKKPEAEQNKRRIDVLSRLVV